MVSSPFAFITILTTDTVNKTTSDEVAIGATNPCTASQNTSSMVNNNLAAYMSILETSNSPNISFGNSESRISASRAFSQVRDTIFSNIGFTRQLNSRISLVVGEYIGILRNSPPLYNFINDSYFVKIPVLKHL